MKVLKDELSANATTVTSNLGGGAHGHLGLVLTPTEYANVSVVPYVRPPHVVPLVIDPGTAQHEATRLRLEHKDSVRLYRETIDVEKALLKQLVAAIEPKYLKAFCNNVTNAIESSLVDVLQQLFTKYGEVVADNLDDLEAKVKQFTYNFSDPWLLYSMKSKN